MNNTLDTKIAKVIGSLASIAFLFAVLYIAAFFRVEKTHAAETLVYANVMIEDNSMRPLALSIPAPSVSAGVDASASANTNTSVSLNIPVNITTSNDLSLYAKTLREEDRDLSAVEATDDHVLVSYRRPGKFLGFIPTSVTARARVNSDGKVSLSYPWYTFLTTKNDATLRTSLQTKVDAAMAGSAYANLGVQSRAQVIETLHLALKEE